MLADTTIKRLNTISEVSKEGKRVNGLYRILESPELFVQAYQNIYSNKGAVTEGSDNVTLDGFSKKRVEKIIALLKEGSYEFQPVRRAYIPKKNGKLRPLGVPNGNDKLVQEAARIILNQIYEPIFSNKSHGFRENRSCHTALTQVKQTWTGVKWIIEMDIKGFFDNLSHDVLIDALELKIDDKRFINLIRNMLKAGYMENWSYHDTYSGTPQGEIISPILANIYLDRLDNFMEEQICLFNRGKGRRENPEYAKLRVRMMLLRRTYERTKDTATKEELEAIKDELDKVYAERQLIKWGDPCDENYKRLTYCRYADDFVIGVIGSKSDAERIAGIVRSYVEKELRLSIAEDKYHIRHASKGVRFLGYDVKSYSGQKIIRVKSGSCNIPQRSVSERIQLIIPKDKIQAFAKQHGYGDFYNHKPECRHGITCGSDAEIVSTYNAELRGFCNYYALGYAANKVLGSFVSLARTSCAMTIAKKHKSTTSKVIHDMKRSNGEWVVVQKGDKKNFEFRLYRMKTDFKPKQFKYQGVDVTPNTAKFCFSRNELVKKLDAETCEWCGSTENVEVHYIRALKDVEKSGEAWKVMMAARHRKALVLCRKCHVALHHGN